MRFPGPDQEQTESEVRVATVVRVPSRNLAKAEFDDTDLDEEGDDWSLDSPGSISDAKSRFLQIATDYAWLNPNAAITVEWFGCSARSLSARLRVAET